MKNKLILRTLPSPYGDATRGSVLSHEDVDSNFINLKGGLIQTGVTTNNNLLLTSFDGSQVTIPLNFTGSTTGGTGIGGITAFTYNNSNVFSIMDSTGVTHSALFNIVSGLTVNGILKNGSNNVSTGSFSHAEGSGTTTVGIGSHSEGLNSTANLDYSHAEGLTSTANAVGSHAEGNNTITNGPFSHAEGNSTITNGNGSHAEGIVTVATGDNSHAEGTVTTANGIASHSEGNATNANGIASHAEGTTTTSIGLGAHSEGSGTTATGNGSHAEGGLTNANGLISHAEGFTTTASGVGSHAEGLDTIASNNYSHAEGQQTTSGGLGSHSEGYATNATGEVSHAEGYRNTANALGSHTEGTLTFAIGDYSHAEGVGTISAGIGQHAQGWYNTTGNTIPLMIIGNGTDDTHRSDLALFYSTGVTINKPLSVSGTIQSDSLVSNRKRVVVADTNGILQTTNETTNGIFYVSRKYTGVGAASITGLTFSSITSSNATYLSQLNDARQGDENNPYPDPYSARNAALDAIASSAITHALIIVSGNDAWLIGSNDPTKNGDLTGNASGHLVADIGFPTGTTMASLLQNNLTYFFNPVTLTFINATYMISVGYVLDLTDAAFSSNIHGHLNVLQIYGEVNGFQANVLTINNANAKIIFEANQLNLQQYQAFNLLNVGNIIIDIERLIGPTMVVGGFASNREGDGSDSIMTIRIDSVTLGLAEIPYPTSIDFWYFNAIGDMSSMRNKLITVSVESMVQTESSDSALFYVSGGANSKNNIQYVLDMGNYHYKDWGHGRNGGGVIGSTGGSTPYSGNTSYNFNIDNALMETAVLGHFWSPPTGSIGTYNMNINVKNCVRIGTVNPCGIINVAGLGFSDLARLKIEGNYYNLNSFPGVIIHNENTPYHMPCRVMLNNAQFRQLSGGTGMQILSASGATTEIGLVDCIFTNDNSVPVLSSDTANSLIYVKNTHASTVATNIVTTGDSLVVLSTINNFI